MIIGWNGTAVPELALSRELEVLSLAGYRGLEVYAPKLWAYLNRHTVDELARQFSVYGLVPLAIHAIENVNLGPTANLKETREQCRRLAAVAKRTGCQAIVVTPGVSPADTSWREIREITVPILRDLADIAASYGARLALEFMAATSIPTLTQAQEIIAATDRENIGLILDTYHFCAGGSSWDSLTLLDVTRLLVVHVADARGPASQRSAEEHRLLPGEGLLPLPRLLAQLHTQGYDGAYSLEVTLPNYQRQPPLECVLAGLEALRNLLEQVGIGHGQAVCKA